jgi:tetratricopeptide (TPR) repeat protein
VYESGLADPGKALEVYRQWVELGVRRSAALLALLRAAEKAGDALIAGEAAMKIGIDVPDLPEPQRVAWRYRAATLYEERAAADTEAIAAFESVLELAPRFRPAFAGLARAYRRNRNWPALADVLSRRAACEASPSRAATLEVEAARVHAERRLAPRRRWRRSIERSPSSREPGGAGPALAHALPRRAAPRRRRRRWAPWPSGSAIRRRGPACCAGSGDPRVAAQATARGPGGRRAGAGRGSLSRDHGCGGCARTSAGAGGPVGDAAGLQLARLGPTVTRGADVATGAIGRRLDLAVRIPDLAEGLRLCTQIVEATPGDLFALEVQALLAHRLGNDRAAAAALERLGAVARDTPFAWAAWRGAIGARARAGIEPSESFDLYQSIAEVDPRSGRAGDVRAAGHRRGDWPRALAARQALVGAAPDERVRALRLWELAVAQAELEIAEAPLATSSGRAISRRT